QDLVAGIEWDRFQNSLDARGGVLDERDVFSRRADKSRDSMRCCAHVRHVVVGHDAQTEELLRLSRVFCADLRLRILHIDGAGAERAVIEKGVFLGKRPEAACDTTKMADRFAHAVTCLCDSRERKLTATERS